MQHANLLKTLHRYPSSTARAVATALRCPRRIPTTPGPSPLPTAPRSNTYKCSARRHTCESTLSLIDLSME